MRKSTTPFLSKAQKLRLIIFSFLLFSLRKSHFCTRWRLRNLGIFNMNRVLDQLRDARRFFEAQNRKKRIENPLRDWSNPMEGFTESEFKRKFRFSKGIVFHVLLPLTIDAIKPSRGHYLSPLLQVMVALRWFSCNSFQHVVADTVQISQPSVCRIVATVARAFAALRPRFIVFPDAEKAEQQKRNFFRIAGFPGVLGCIDGTHIKILKPQVQDAEIYRNRKGYFSINVQAVCNSDLSFSNVVARWFGSAHDNRIMENSRLDANLRTGNAPEGHLLGDGGYTNSKYLLIPYEERQMRTAADKRYNEAHIKTRNLVERSFGVLKKRFYCLATELRTKLKNTLPIIVACFVLHNIAIKHNVQMDFEEEFNEAENEQPDEERGIQNVQGNAYRRQFAQTHFSHPDDNDELND